MNKWSSWRKPMLATVAITRARSLCFIMGPLDMKGLLGAATVMGTLMYGAVSGLAKPIFIFMMVNSPVHRLMRRSFTCSNRTVACLVPHFPPPAIVEALQDYVTHYYKVRRLHLIVVDLWLPWKYNTARAREITDQLWRISHGDDTHRVSPFRPDGPEPPLRCRRFAYGYALDGSEYPSYQVWPQRDGNPTLFWIPPQLTRFLSIMISFAHWVWNTSMIPSHWWVGGWGPRYLASKRERGPVRVPSSLTKDSCEGGPLMFSNWNHERTWLRHTP